MKLDRRGDWSAFVVATYLTTKYPVRHQEAANRTTIRLS